MTITSLTTLRLHPSITPTTPSLIAVLTSTIHTLETASNDLAANILTNFPSHNETHIPDSELPKEPTSTSTSPHTFHVYSQHEDPSILYILGSWPSRALHMNSFLPSAANADIIASLKAYVDFAQSEVHHITLNPLLIPTDAPLLVIRHHAISPMNLAEFEDAMDSASLHLSHVSQRSIASGWQVERAGSGGAQKAKPDEVGDGSQVFVVFSGWEDLGHHREFQDGEKGREYERVREWVDEGGLEVRHAVKVELE